MTQINSNFDNNNSLPVQNRQNVPAYSSLPSKATNIPDFYVVSTDEHKTWRDKIKENPFTAVGYEFFLRGTEHPVSTILTWLAVSFGLDAYSKSCGGNYNTSLLKKVANVGDNIENSRIIKSQPSQFVLGGFKKTDNLLKKLVNNSAVLRAMKNTPSMPEWPMVKQEMLPYKLKVCEDFFHITNSLHLTDDGNISLNKLVVSKNDKNALKRFFNISKLSEISEEKAVNYILLRQLGKKDSEIQTILNLKDRASEATKNEIRKTLNLSKETIIAAQKEISNGDLKNQYYSTVLNATKAGSGKVRVKAGNIKFIGPFSRPFERVIGCDELYNKLFSISDGAKTSTGRFFSKMMQLTHRGLTFGQGKWGLLLLIIPSIVDVGRDIAKAEPDQKLGTAANGFVESISWVFTFPIALHIMHAFGGIQYAGMTPEQVSEYRKIINDFNEKNKNGFYKNKTAYDIAKQEAKAKLKHIREKAGLKKQNIFTKGLRNIAKMFTMDLETFKAREGQNFFLKKLHQIPNFFKNCFGVPVRFGIWSALSMFVLGGILTKATSFLFGKAYDSMKVEENKENKKAQKKFLKEDLNNRLYEIQKEKSIEPYGAKQRPNAVKTFQTVSRGNMHAQEYFAENANENKIDNYTYIPSSENIIPSPIGKGTIDTYTYIPSQENVLNTNNNSANNPNKRSYVPSQAAANIEKIWDNSGLQAALNRADIAEQKALKILAGNFEQE